MKPLILLIVVFCISALATHFYHDKADLVFSGNMSMFIMLVLTAIGHFKFTAGMTMMMPTYIPFKKELIYATGIFEIFLGIALLFPALRQIAGIALIVLLVLMLPANINAAAKHINLEKATNDGPGLRYLWFRIPLQFFFIAWVIYFSIKI